MVSAFRRTKRISHRYLRPYSAGLGRFRRRRFLLEDAADAGGHPQPVRLQDPDAAERLPAHL